MRRRSRGCGGQLTRTRTTQCLTSVSQSALARLERLEEARAAAQVGLSLDPHFTIAVIAPFSLASDNPVWLVEREREYEGLRKAGVPEE